MVFGDDDDDVVVEIQDEDGSPAAVVEEVDDEAGEQDPPAKAKKESDELTDEELQGYSKKVQTRINKMTAKSRAEQERLARERDEALAQAQRYRDEANGLRGTVNKSQSTVVDQAKRSAVAEHAAAKTAYKQAYESGDADLVLAAQERLTTATLRLDKVNSFKLTPLQVETAPVKDTPKDVKPQAHPKTQAWTERNDWFGKPGEEEKTAFALAVHTKLARSGVEVNSDEYFAKIDERIKAVFGSNEDDDDSTPTPKKRVSAVAAVTRTPGSVKIKLNPRQQSLARSMGITNEQYARELAKIEDKRNG